MIKQMIAASILVLALAACEQRDEPAVEVNETEQVTVRETVEDAADATADATEDAVEATKEAADEAVLTDEEEAAGETK